MEKTKRERGKAEKFLEKEQKRKKGRLSPTKRGIDRGNYIIGNNGGKMEEAG